ncbi:conserved hypothetical protein [Desulfitobacterium hafniense DCB-2]|uniref:Prohead protease n=1 Tax=Desulfitobacterium hafniense (strain DSM 10664 / DCB-2) TaxID=272564 RepID=B8FNZ1_DESHD|nr:hypothetical protein [Desulfitobacterium hafniense]ACL19516.1 conserved hypothetical protein [Desulfitobacterium hafniense DCB-2]
MATNIKQLLNQVLSSPEIVNLLPNKRVYFLHAEAPEKPYLEYEIIDEFGEAWAENREIATNYYIQVDIFSMGDYTAIENAVKDTMISYGFKRSMSVDLYENDIKLYHKVMRFVITLKNK